SRRRHTRFSRDWSSDVCSSDLFLLEPAVLSRRDGPPMTLQGVGIELVLGKIVFARHHLSAHELAELRHIGISGADIGTHVMAQRSEERRVGKEGRSGWVGCE